HPLLVVAVQAGRRRGLGRRALRLRRSGRLALSRLFPLLLLLLLRLGGGRRRGLSRGHVGGLRLLALGRLPGVGLAGLLRFLLFRVRHRAISLSPAESAGPTSPRSAAPCRPCPRAAGHASAPPTWGRAA